MKSNVFLLVGAILLLTACQTKYEELVQKQQSLVAFYDGTNNTTLDAYENATGSAEYNGVILVRQFPGSPIPSRDIPVEAASFAVLPIGAIGEAEILVDFDSNLEITGSAINFHEIDYTGSGG